MLPQVHNELFIVNLDLKNGDFIAMNYTNPAKAQEIANVRINFLVLFSFFFRPTTSVVVNPEVVFY